MRLNEGRFPTPAPLPYLFFPFQGGSVPYQRVEYVVREGNRMAREGIPSIGVLPTGQLVRFPAISPRVVKPYVTRWSRTWVEERDDGWCVRTRTWENGQCVDSKDYEIVDDEDAANVLADIVRAFRR